MSWLCAQGVCQTFSAMLELPVLPRNVGTGQGQTEKRRRARLGEPGSQLHAQTESALSVRERSRRSGKSVPPTDREAAPHVGGSGAARRDPISEASAPAWKAVARTFARPHNM